MARVPLIYKKYSPIPLPFPSPLLERKRVGLLRDPIILPFDRLSSSFFSRCSFVEQGLIRSGVYPGRSMTLASLLSIERDERSLTRHARYRRVSILPTLSLSLSYLVYRLSTCTRFSFHGSEKERERERIGLNFEKSSLEKKRKKKKRRRIRRSRGNSYY